MSGLLRRRWLLGALASGATATWSALPLAAPRSANAEERVRKKLISLLRDMESVRQAGAFYLQLQMERLAPPQRLAAAVLAEMGPNAGIETIRRYVVGRIRRELENVQVISLDGWIMSPTEAQLCALIAAGGTR